ncbi:MAG: hypothetical protein F9B45_25750 [Phycisphaera sp. RhM]|nr:hypothetical protein [Phycisphaera sp. RhM]
MTYIVLYEIGDLGGGIEDLDVGDLGADFDTSIAPGFGGGGFQYDQGGFNDYGSNMSGGDWRGSEFGGGDFGGGFDDS